MKAVEWVRASVTRVDVKLTDTPGAFDLPEWQNLVAHDANRHIFATPEWNRLWWSMFGEGKKLYVLTFLDPEPVGLAAVMLDRPEDGGRLRFVGGDDLTDYLGPLCSQPDHLPGIAEALVTYFRDEIPHWSWLEAKCLPVPFGFAEPLVEAADRLGLRFTIDQDEVTAVLPLPTSFESYLDQLPSKQRHELRRKVRRFEEKAPGASVITAGDKTLMVDLASFIGMHRGSEGIKGKFMGPHRAIFFSRVAEAFQPLGWLSLDFLKAGEDLMASTFSFTYDRCFYLYNSAYEKAAAGLSPGLILAARLIARCIEQGFAKFDFLRGKERYKFDLGAEPLPLYSVRLDRSS